MVRPGETVVRAVGVQAQGMGNLNIHLMILRILNHIVVAVVVAHGVLETLVNHIPVLVLPATVEQMGATAVRVEQPEVQKVEEMVEVPVAPETQLRFTAAAAVVAAVKVVHRVGQVVIRAGLAIKVLFMFVYRLDE